MKKSFSLIEVIISIVLLCIVLYSFITLNKNNVFIVQKIKNTSIYNNLINIVTSPTSFKQSNESLYLDNDYSINKNDKLRKKYKDIKISKKTNLYEIKSLTFDNSLNLDIKIYKSTYSLNNLSKSFFEVEIK